MPMISIIIPMYNCEKYIEKCVNSILVQTYPDIEVIVVDDGSTDCSYQIVSKLAEKDSRLVLLSQPNQGVSAARNLGLQKATGRYISFADSDDWLNPEQYQCMLDSILANHSDCCVCGCIVEDDKGRLIKKRGMEQNGCCDSDEGLCLLFIPDKFNGVLWNKLFRREMLFSERGDIFNWFDSSIHVWEDVVWCYLVFSHCRKISYISTHTYHYVQHDSNITRKGFSEKKLSMLTAAEILLKNSVQGSSVVRKQIISYIFMNFRGLSYEIKTADRRYGKEYERIMQIFKGFHQEKLLSPKEEIHYRCLLIHPLVDLLYSKMLTMLLSILRR